VAKHIGNRMSAAIGCLLLACGFAAVSAVTALAGPKIRTIPETFDFGYVPEGESVSHRYWLSNDGDDTLRIELVKPQCGCTTVPLPTDRLAPSDSIPLDLSFDSKNIRGRVNKAVRVWSNDSTLYPAVIYFTADVADSAQTIIANPPVASLTTIDNPHQVIELSNLTHSAYRVGLATAPPPFLNCEFAHDSVAAGQTLTLTITPGPGAPLGEYRTSITLQCEGELSFPLTIPIRGIGYMQ